MRKSLMAGIVSAALFASIASAQTAPEKKEVLSNGGLLHSLLAAPVPGQPYSAVQITRNNQKLADGTNITHSGHHFVARDASGRVRVEMRLANASDGQPETILVFVTDPVAHTITTWVTGPKANKLASVVKVPAEKSTTAKAAPAQIRQDNRPQPIITTEDLGTDSLQGLPVSVVKTTTIVPAGRSGNDAPITKTHEVWTSTDMKLVLKEQWEDPRIGERTVSLEQFSRADPDAALFRPPAGYTIKDALQSLKELEEKLNQTQN
ncbi:hypothetical protein EDE15_3794 [Edaphobacter aggregans]|uniref:Uncharacterized protein n=1 Tax=Edaphobacter aggregans TaxID=570835 RepID=A0A428MMX9_9BACT|nr:hypothetical protein [Edaphobacter aggregans]RSL18235.1 hypothetical protein EDE15_3794 [Edaphobacter aggregans]